MSQLIHPGIQSRHKETSPRERDDDDDDGLGIMTKKKIVFFPSEVGGGVGDSVGAQPRVSLDELPRLPLIRIGSFGDLV